MLPKSPSQRPIAVVGLGALGSVLASHLLRDGHPVVAVVPERQMHRPTSVVVQRVGQPAVQRSELPALSSSIPSDARVALLCVRAENVDADLVDALAASSPAVISFTPLLPSLARRMSDALGSRLVVAMPGIVAYRNGDDVIRYWLPRVAPTLLDASAESKVADIAQLLVQSGISVRFQQGVQTLNPATTITFLPFVLAVDLAGASVSAAVRDRQLVVMMLDAVRECERLASCIGPLPTWASALTKFAGPRMLKLGVALAERSYPEAVVFVERHFGTKTREQNIVLAREVVSLGKERGVGMDAMTRLVEACVASRGK